MACLIMHGQVGQQQQQQHDGLKLLLMQWPPTCQACNALGHSGLFWGEGIRGMKME